MSIVTRFLALPLAAVCLIYVSQIPAPAAPASPAPQVSKETAAALRDRLAVLVNNAITRNAFDDMLASLSKNNRDRIAETPFTNHARINDALRQLRQSYRAAYGRDLHIPSDAFAEVTFFVDEDLDHARARVTLSGQTFELHLVREAYIANRWRLDLTNPTADSLADALATRLDTLAATSWPRDPAAAQRHISLTILDSLTNARRTPVINASSR